MVFQYALALCFLLTQFLGTISGMHNDESYVKFKYSFEKQYCSANGVKTTVIRRVLRKRKVAHTAAKIAVDLFLEELAFQSYPPFLRMASMQRAVCDAEKVVCEVVAQRYPDDLVLQPLMRDIRKVLLEDEKLLQELMKQSIVTYQEVIYQRPESLEIIEPSWRENGIFVTACHMVVVLAILSTVAGLTYALS